MGALARSTFDDRAPTEFEIESARTTRRVIAPLVQQDEMTHLKLISDGDEKEIILSPAMTNMLMQMLRHISMGESVRVVPVNAVLTTQQAADELNVSRPFLIKLLDREEMPFTFAGRHRRILAKDLFAYKDKRDGRRKKFLASMAEQDFAAGDI